MLIITALTSIFDVYCKVNTIVLTVHNLTSTCAHPRICREVHVSHFFRFRGLCVLFYLSSFCLAPDVAPNVARVSLLFIHNFPINFLFKCIYNIWPSFCLFIWHMEMSDIFHNEKQETYHLSVLYILPIDTSWQEFPFRAQYEFLGEQTQCPMHVWAEHRRIRSRYPPGINWNWWCITGLTNPTWKSWKVFLICLCSNCVWYIIWLSKILTLNVSDEGYSRNASCTLNLISTLLYRWDSQIYSQYDIVVVTY